MSGPFKMKGFSGFGNSPAKQKEFKLKVGEGQGSKRTGKYTSKTKKFSDLTPEEIKQMKLDQPMGSPAKQSEYEDIKSAKKVISKSPDEKTTVYTKGARTKKDAIGTSEKGKKTTYTKGEGGTYTKKVQKIKKGATSDKEWETKKEKTISAKRAERQIRRKTKRAERSAKRQDIKEIRGIAKGLKKAGHDKKEVKKWKKETIKGTKNRSSTQEQIKKAETNKAKTKYAKEKLGI